MAARRGVRVDTVNDAFAFVESHPSVDREVAHSIEESGYLTHYLADEQANPYRYKPEVFWGHPECSPGMVRTELEMNRREVTRVKNRILHLAKRPQLLVFDHERELHRNRLRQIATRLRVLMLVSGKCGYIDLADDSLREYSILKGELDRMKAVRALVDFDTSTE
tara:strand:- start:663 stop:1157 length:495 start_codon:yes stop_codon:yes gene_type:complete